MSDEAMVEAHGLREALRGDGGPGRVDLEVAAGAILGVLGPNGAGKSTAVRILTTLALPDAGRARVAGYDVVTQAARVRRAIGVTAQDATLDEALTGRQNLLMAAELSGLRRSPAQSRAAELLEQFDLAAAADRMVKGYSGGMRRRLDLAASLVTRPPVLFLDEPTTGLDPTSRLRMWDVIRELVAEGTTIMLTTQYLDEADQLADQIVLIDHGLVIARGTPGELKTATGGAQLEATLTEAHPAAVEALAPWSMARSREPRWPTPASLGAEHVGPGHVGGPGARPSRRGGRRRGGPPPVAGRVFFALTGTPAASRATGRQEVGLMAVDTATLVPAISSRPQVHTVSKWRRPRC